jgi:hypothetical protein
MPQIFLPMPNFIQILGFGCNLFVFVAQIGFVWLYQKQQKTKQLSKAMKLSRLIAYDAMLLVALVGNVASFRGLWNIMDAFFIPSRSSTCQAYNMAIGRQINQNPLLSKLMFYFTDNMTADLFICQFVGLFYMFLFYAGTSLHGGVVMDNEDVMMSHFFLTYLLSTKAD